MKPTHELTIAHDGTPSFVIGTTMGSCVHLDVRWLDEAGAPIDITGSEVAVTDAKPEVINEASLIVVGGKLQMQLHSAKAEKLGQGRTNRFRLERRVPGEACPKMSRDIWIQVD